MKYVAFALIGVIIGIIFTFIVLQNVGTLIIDERDIQTDIYRIELDKDPTYMKKQKVVLLKIHVLK